MQWSQDRQLEKLQCEDGLRGGTAEHGGFVVANVVVLGGLAYNVGDVLRRGDQCGRVLAGAECAEFGGLGVLVALGVSQRRRTSHSEVRAFDESGVGH